MAKQQSGTFSELFDRLEAALGDAESKRNKADQLAKDLAQAQSDVTDAVTVVKGLQAEYATRLGGVHPDLAPGVSVSD